MILTTKNLQYTDLIEYVSEETLAKYYLGIGINKPFNSLTRTDDHDPSARLYYWHNRIYYNDFVTPAKTLSDLIMYVKGWSYKDLLANIKQDFMSGGVITYKNKKVSKNRSNTPIELKVKYRDWQPWDDEYWLQGGITREWLEFARIFPVKYYFLYGRTFKAHKWAYTYDTYTYDGIFRRKIYQPKSEDKSKKWISNINHTVLTGVKTLPKKADKMIIASSYKDSGVIQCNLTLPGSRQMFPSCAPNNEQVWLPEVVVPDFKQRFKDIYVLFDNDYAGHTGSNKYVQKYDYKPLFIPEHLKAKDPFEYCEIHGIIDFIKLGKYLIENYD